jgi:hypothetical protein
MLTHRFDKGENIDDYYKAIGQTELVKHLKDYRVSWIAYYKVKRQLINIWPLKQYLPDWLISHKEFDKASVNFLKKDF